MAEEKEKKEKKPKAEGQHPKGGGDAAHKGGEGAQKGKGGGGDKSKRKPKGPETEVEMADDGPQAPAPPARLAAVYREQVVPALTQQFGYKNKMAVPRLEKIIISMGLGRFATEGCASGSASHAGLMRRIHSEVGRWRAEIGSLRLVTNDASGLATPEEQSANKIRKGHGHQAPGLEAEALGGAGEAVRGKAPAAQV